MKPLAFSLLFVFALALPGQVHAFPHWPGQVVHEVKQTVVDFALWRDPEWNLVVLADIGANLADAKASSDHLARCPLCVESRASLYGGRPSFGRIAGTELSISFIDDTFSHFLRTHHPAKNPPPGWKYYWLIPPAIDIAGKTQAAAHNAGLR